MVQFGAVLTLGETLQGGQRLAAIPLLDTDVDVILLASYVLITKLLSFVCKRVYIHGGGSDHAIVIVGETPPRDKKCMAERRAEGGAATDRQY